MTLRPLFFLPRSFRRWAYEQACSEKLMEYWVVRVIFCSIDKYGILFPYKGDEVIWTWPWRRKGLAPFISLSFSGDGSFSDARYWTLEELDKARRRFFEECDRANKRGTIIGTVIEDSRWNEEAQSWEVEIELK